jgi:hypothetical protein
VTNPEKIACPFARDPFPQSDTLGVATGRRRIRLAPNRPEASYAVGMSLASVGDGAASGRPHRREPMFLTILHDLRYGWRTLARAPGFMAAAAVTLALGIAATTALFTVVNGVLLRPLPYPNPDDLVLIYGAYPERGIDRGTLSRPDARDWSERSRTLAGWASTRRCHRTSSCRTKQARASWPRLMCPGRCSPRSASRPHSDGRSKWRRTWPPRGSSYSATGPGCDISARIPGPSSAP